MSSSPSKDDLAQALAIVRAGAERAAVAGRLHPDGEQRLLQSIVDATVRLFDAEAASIALFERNPDRLEFKVAAGPQGAGAIGKSVKPSQGIAGFVFSSGQALALSDVASDPRFDRKTAEKTGYVPRSIAAVPLTDEQGTHGVLQVLDKKGTATFDMRDMELIGVFAAQAATAIAVTRAQRELPILLRAAFNRSTNGTLTDAQLDALVTAAAADLDLDEESPFWQLADQVAELRTLGEPELTLVSDMLAAVAANAAARRTRSRRR
ncbi:MAG TPA: GAF domain-containing protein [Candidatus Limnocylindria bacterium]|jgi:GAF domain-containing protein